MSLLYYIYKYPYKLGWYLTRILRKNSDLVFYCADPLDYEMFLPINKFLPHVGIIAKNKKTRLYLDSKGIPFKRMPQFPKSVIMARHSPYKFPVKKINKIGFDHGLYQFKRWTNPKYYNMFDIYFVSSHEQVKTAESLGITTAKAIGYPKLDNAFNGTFSGSVLSEIRNKLKLDLKKKTIIFTSTWDIDGLSALDRWIDRVGELTETYNVLITVHTWTKKEKVEKLKKVEGAFYLDSFDVTPYIMISDVFIGDYNSLIGEACGLDIPIITFRVPESNRSIKEITEMIENISIRIDNFDEIHEAIERSLNAPGEKKVERQKANQKMYFALDGMAGKRAAENILNILK